MNPQEKKHLKQQAHSLKPVIMVGSKGLTDAVHEAVDEALHAHELIKIRLSAEDRQQRADWITALLEQHEASLIQQIGHIVAIYRKKPEPTEAT